MHTRGSWWATHLPPGSWWRVMHTGRRGPSYSENCLPVMRDRLREDLTAAIKARDRVAVTALRTALAAIDNAEAVDADPGGPRAASSQHVAGASAGVGSSDVPRRVLSQAEVGAIVRTQADERWQAAADYEKLGRTDAADVLRREADVLSAYVRGTGSSADADADADADRHR